MLLRRLRAALLNPLVLLPIVWLAAVTSFALSGLGVPYAPRLLNGLLVVGSTLAIVAALASRRLPTLVFYGLLLAFALYLEDFNFGRLRPRSWLIFVGMALSVEIGITYFLERWSARAASAFSAAYHVVLALPLAGVWIYNLRFGVGINKDTILALLQTTAFESREFVVAYGQPWLLVVPVVLGLLLALLAWAAHRTRGQLVPAARLTLIVGLLVPQALFTYDASPLMALSTRTIASYFTELEQFRKLQREREKALPNVLARATATGQTFVLVLGESQNRGHMSVYGYPRKTTPWLDAQASKPGWLKFTSGYSNHTHTVPVLSLALTAANQYNEKSYYGSPSILDVLRAAGFRVYWLSNQIGLGGWDNPVTAIAETADVYVRTNKRIGETTDSQYLDARLVDVFDQLAGQIDPSQNNLIVFHLMGSHQYYCRRFPGNAARFRSTSDRLYEASAETFRQMSTDDIAARIDEVDCYDNSILFTDSVLEGIFARVQRLDGFRGFVYSADHADDALHGLGHDSPRFTFPMAHIPLVMAFSDRFVAEHPDRYETLRRHQDRVWTNDLLYDTLVGITGLVTDFHQPRYDLSNAAFDLPLGSARTMHGQRRVEDDPALRRDPGRLSFLRRQPRE